MRKQVTVRLLRPDGQEVRVGKGPEVTLAGEPVDLVLYLMGRKGVAQVEPSRAIPPRWRSSRRAKLGI